jgi:CRISPR system Cascade subunit CasD
MEFLAFRLYGPMASWGDTTLTRRRPTLYVPTKSAVSGLLGAAIGLNRKQSEGFWESFSTSFGMSVKVDHVGRQLLADYHTVFAYKQDESEPLPANRKKEVEVIRSAIREGKEGWGSILSTRHYVTDFLATILIWKRKEQFPSLENIQDDLIFPRYSLYIGRKSCPVALPMEPQVLVADTLIEAFKSARFKVFDFIDFFKERYDSVLYWENDVPLGNVFELGNVPVMTMECRDVPISRTAWTFRTRLIKHGVWPKEVAQ